MDNRLRTAAGDRSTANHNIGHVNPFLLYSFGSNAILLEQGYVPPVVRPQGEIPGGAIDEGRFTCLGLQARRNNARTETGLFLSLSRTCTRHTRIIFSPSQLL